VFQFNINTDIILLLSTVVYSTVVSIRLLPTAMMSLFASFTRRIFICTISIIALLSHDVVVVVVAAAADAAAADAAASDASSMMSCEKIAPLWISTPYNASVMYDNGDTEIIAGLQANLTITEQVGCRAVGINSWTNGMVSFTVRVLCIFVSICYLHFLYKYEYEYEYMNIDNCV
jgi:hypothetical protein